MKHIVLSSAIAAATWSGPAWAEQYVCEMGQSTGFALVQGEWVQVRFEDSSRYLINTDTMTVSQFGREGTFFEGDDCVLLGGNAPEFMRCLPDQSIFAMTFSLNSMRFVLTSHGYANGDGDTRNDPAVGIGTCAELGR